MRCVPGLKSERQHKEVWSAPALTQAILTECYNACVRKSLLLCSRPLAWVYTIPVCTLRLRAVSLQDPPWPVLHLGSLMPHQVPFQMVLPVTDPSEDTENQLLAEIGLRLYSFPRGQPEAGLQPGPQPWLLLFTTVLPPAVFLSREQVSKKPMMSHCPPRKPSRSCCQEEHPWSFN